MFSNVQNKSELDIELLLLEEKKIIFNNLGYYSICKDKTLLKRRLIGNQKAQSIMPKAIEKGKLIAKFPYIESVCISGSLSKNYFDENGDVDFFIITKPNRLWLARTLLTLYKKVFLLNSRKYFCVNYYVSKDNLELDEKNRFTATEIATLIPVAGKNDYYRFREENLWVEKYFPNLKSYEIINHKGEAKNKISKSIEFLFNTKLGDYVESKVMRLNLNRWRKKHSNLSKEDFEVAFKSSHKVSKSHPSNFQAKVLKLLNEKYKEIEEKHNIKLTLEYA